MTNTNTKRMVETALLLAMATLLSLFKPFSLPFGGGITIVSMLPVVLIAYRYGTRWGIFSAFVGSLLQMLTGFDTISAAFMPGDSQMLVWQALLMCVLDYFIAYTALGFGGIFRNKIKNGGVALCLGSIVAVTLRYIVHIISGAILYGAWAEWFFTQDGFPKIGQQILDTFSGTSLSIVYSIFYNGLYMVPEIIITAIVAVIIGNVPQLGKKID